MLFPLRDINLTVRTPVATIALIGLNIASWALIQGFGGAEPLARSLCLFALIPGELLHLAPANAVIHVGANFGCNLADVSIFTLISHQFLHGGWFHLITNMWFLWVFGDNVEDAMGPVRFVVFYLLCGLAAAFAQIASSPGAMVPMVGASGAIGGVLGGYVRLYPRAQIHCFLFLGIFFTTVMLPAIAMLGYWFILQIGGALPGVQGEGGVAFWAHIGGFVAGILLAGPIRRDDYYSAHLSKSQS